MIFDSSFCRRLFVCAILVALSCFCAASAQDISEIHYQEDYDQLQKIVKIADPGKRAEQMIAFYKGRSNLDPKLSSYADTYFVRDMESLMKQGNFGLLKDLSGRAIKSRPKFGEAYLFYAAALKFEKKIEDAMVAFAKCYLIKNPLQTRAKQLLDVTYRNYNKGSMIGEEKFIKIAMQELK
jgi:hypothetical protein